MKTWAGPFVRYIATLKHAGVSVRSQGVAAETLAAESPAAVSSDGFCPAKVCRQLCWEVLLTGPEAVN